MSDTNIQVYSTHISEILFKRFYRIVDDTISLYKSYKKSIENNFNEEEDNNYKILNEIKNSEKFLTSELGTTPDQRTTILSTLVLLTTKPHFPKSKKFSHLNDIVNYLNKKINEADNLSLSSVQSKDKTMFEYISSIFYFHKYILEEFIYKIELIIFEDFIDILLKTKLFKYSFLNKTEEEKDNFGSTLRFWKEVNSKGGITNMMYTIYGYVIKEMKDDPIKEGNDILSEVESKYNKEILYIDDRTTLVNSMFPETESETIVEDLHKELDGSEFTKGKGDDNYKLILNNGYKISNYETLKNFIINSSIIFIGIGLNKLRFKIEEEDEIFKIKDLKTFIKEDLVRSLDHTPNGVYNIKVENLINIDKNKYKNIIDKMKETLEHYDSGFKFSQKEEDLYKLVENSKSKEAYSVLVSLLFNKVVDVYIINALIEYFKNNLKIVKGKKIFKDFKYSETKREDFTKIINSIIDYIIENTTVDSNVKNFFNSDNPNSSKSQYKNLVYLYILYKSATNKEVKFSEDLTEVFNIGDITSYIKGSDIKEGEITVDDLGNIKSSFALRIIDYFDK